MAPIAKVATTAINIIISALMARLGADAHPTIIAQPIYASTICALMALLVASARVTVTVTAAHASPISALMVRAEADAM